MALKKAMRLASGVTATYHNVTIIKDTPARTVRYRVDSYLSKQARDAERRPVHEGEMATLPNEYTGAVEEAVYAYLKTLPEFNGAEDV